MHLSQWKANEGLEATFKPSNQRDVDIENNV